MRVLDLFSGIGGFSLGLQRAGMMTVAFCEVDPWCRELLALRWPGVPIYDDVRTLDAARLVRDGIAVDVICGGFPCQDVSIAGSGQGLDGERSGLWREFARLVGELRPRYAIVENVGALVGRGLSRVLGDLAEIGYDAQWHVVPAAAVGAPHLRERVWIIASDSEPLSGRRRPAEDPRSPRAGEGEGTQRQRVWVESGASGGLDDASDANSERRERFWLAEHGDMQGPSRLEPDRLGEGRRRGGADAPDAAGERLAISIRLQRSLARAFAATSASWERTAESPLRGVDDGIPTRVHGLVRARLGGLNADQVGSAQARAASIARSVERDLRELRGEVESSAASPRLCGPGPLRDSVPRVPREGGPTGWFPRSEDDGNMRHMRAGVHAEVQPPAQDLQSEMSERVGQTERDEALVIGKLVRAQDKNRLQGLGNAVVPEIVERIGKAVMEVA
jgi:DNA (cytosine-5)-methyltransferase 1